jgi:hypothetical protein
MTNAVYMTPHLPLKRDDTCPTTDFENSILEYFSFYSPSRTGELVSRLKKYDFSSVKAQFIASVPGKFETGVKKWGLARLGHILKGIPSSPQTELFAQVTHLMAPLSPSYLPPTLGGIFPVFTLNTPIFFPCLDHNCFT